MDGEGVFCVPTGENLDRLGAIPQLSQRRNWYRAPKLLENPHLHTILGSLYRKAPGVRWGIVFFHRNPHVFWADFRRYEREILPTEDGGSLALDVVKDFDGSHLVSDSKEDWILLLSGLGGGSEDSYVQSMAVAAARGGFHVAVLNMRGCGNTPVTSPRFFSAMRGSVDDMKIAVRHLRGKMARSKSEAEAAPGFAPRVSAIGWSNGATIVNNFAALQSQYNPAERINFAATLCCPFDMSEADQGFRKPFNKLVYNRALSNKLVSKLKENIEVFSNHDIYSLEGKRVDINLDRLLEARTIREIDAELTCKIFDYPSVDAYYADSSSTQRLKHVEIPVILISAMDDPLVPGQTIPYAEAAKNENLVLAATRHGGHLGWIPQGPTEKTKADGSRWTAEWVEQSVMNFLISCHS